jgi:hypothetical protein
MYRKVALFWTVRKAAINNGQEVNRGFPSSLLRRAYFLLPQMMSRDTLNNLFKPACFITVTPFQHSSYSAPCKPSYGHGRRRRSPDHGAGGSFNFGSDGLFDGSFGGGAVGGCADDFSDDFHTGGHGKKKKNKRKKKKCH